MPADASSSVYPGLFYPDFGDSVGAMDLSGVHAVCMKRSEGTYYLNPYYEGQVAQAQAAGAFHFAYHFLTNEDPQAQARYCFDNLGPHVPLMVDVETETQTGSQPSLDQNVAFVHAFRGLGGVVYLNYLPRWYWMSPWGQPDLTPLKDLGLVLVSSDYSGYATNVGWAAYGGWAPTIWQYSDTISLHGHTVDFNAFLGSGTADVPTLVEEFRSVVTTGKLTGGKTWHEWTTAGDRSLRQIADACHMTPAAVLRATAIRYGRYDQVLHDYLDNLFTGTLDPTAKMPAGARLWVLA